MTTLAAAKNLGTGRPRPTVDMPPADPAAELARSCGAARRLISLAAPADDPRLDAARRVASSAAHDFNNVLSGIIGNLQLAQRRADGDKAILEVVNPAMEAALRGSDLARRLSAVADDDAGDGQAVDVNAAVAAMTAALKRTVGPDIAVVTELADGVPVVATEATQLEAAILCLAANARDAMPGGGTLTVDTAAVAIGDDAAAVAPGVAAGVYACVSVGDTGRGMAPEMVERAFAPFFSTRMSGGGSGLGLSVVADVVRRARGHLAVDSRPGHGTRIRLLLPAAGPRKAAR